MGGLLAALCLLHVLSGVARAGSLGVNFFRATPKPSFYDTFGGGCSYCDLDNMVTNCPLDVMFVLDMSDSIPHLTFERARQYVANQIQAVNDAFEGTEIGFLSFSNIVYDEEAIEARNSHELLRMIERVRNVKQRRHGTQLGVALRRARNALDARVHGYPYGSLRPHGKLIVLVSDGCEDRNGSVYREAVSAMANNISIISVAIGDSYIDFLNKISMQVLELRTNIDWHSIVACPSTYLPPVSQRSACGNVMFAMDGSDSVRRWETVMRNYLAYAFARYDHVVNAMGVVVFGTNANDQSPDTILRLSFQKSQLINLVKTSLKFPTHRGTGTTQAIEVSVRNLREGPIDAQSHRSWSPISKTIIIITDGQALSPEHARQAVRNALHLGIQVIVVGVGNVITEEELRQMAGSSCIVLKVDSYLDLFSVDFSKYICSASHDCRSYGPCPSRNQDRDITRNCQCHCPNRIFCSANQRPNYDTCSCEPICPHVRSCGAGYEYNYTSCACVPRACTITSCPYGFTLNRTCIPCQCQCYKRCYYPYELDEQSCTCVPRACTITSCPYGFTLDQTRTPCQCVCPHKTCGAHERLNSETCRCEPICRNVRNCGDGYRFNYATCTCECIKRCYSPFQLDHGSCNCVCPHNYKTCGAHERLNSETCRCEPICRNVRSCGDGYRFNYATCTCECIKRCYSPFQLDHGSCNCVCPHNYKTCGAHERLNSETCRCEPICRNVRSCGDGYQFNYATCTCECIKRCYSPFQLDHGSCNCVCPHNYKTCGAHERLNSETCRCEPICRNVRSCGDGYRFNYATCTCECIKRCYSPFQLDHGSCNCVCPHNYKTCGAHERLNSETCRCEPICRNVRSCGDGYQFNYATCTCECIKTCYSPFQLDHGSCNCVCPHNYKTCGAHERLNSETCRCEPICGNVRSCEIGYQFNYYTCTCEPRPCTITNCPYGFTLNRTCIPCECVCTRSCPSGYTLDTNTCRCERACYQTSPCSAGYYFDENRCQCVPHECPIRSCPYGSTLDRSRTPCECVPHECPVRSCPHGFTLDRSRTPCECVPKHAQYCSARELQCENGQPAVQDCRGRCICKCDVSQYVGKYCEIPVTPHLCDNCTFINGHYMAPVSDRCDMFAVCQRLGDGSFKPSITLCGEGTILKKNGFQLTCDSPESAGVCPVDPCRNQRDGTLIGHSTLCGRYWKCNGGVTTSFECCPSGQGFDKDSGRCVPDFNCPNHCAKGFQSCGTNHTVDVNSCPYKTVAGDPNKFFSPLVPYAIMPCPPNKIFDVDVCTCVQNPNGDCGPYYDIDFDTPLDSSAENVDLLSGIQSGNGIVGLFKGDSRIIMTRFSGSGFYFDYLEITLRVKFAVDVNFNSGRQMVIVSNGDCGNTESIAITTDGQRVYFKVTPVGSAHATVVVIPCVITNNGWLNIDFRYVRQGGTNAFLLTATVNGQTKDITVTGVIAERQCSLQLGHGLGYDGLEGYVDDFKVWICKPGY